MDVSGLASFTNALKDIEKTKGYIAGQDGRYFVVSTKETKMNTAAISHTAIEALSCIQSAPLSYKESARSYQELADGLKGYINRVYAQKTVIQKLAWWLGLSSKEEKSLYRSYRDALSQSKQLLSQDNKVQGQIKFQYSFLQEAEPEKMLYMSVLDSSRLSIPELDGARASAVINWMLTCLSEYAATCPAGSPAKAKVEQTCEKMNKMLELSLVEDALFFTDAVPLLQFFAPTNMQEWLEKELLSNIRTLSPGESFSFQGGYIQSSNSRGGHAVQYNFTAQADNTVSLTFFNSGEGAHQRVHQGEASKPSILGFFKTIFYPEEESTKKAQVLVHDYHWDNIPQEAITQDFMQLLLRARIKKVPTAMREIHTQVTSYLKNFNIECKTDAVGHKPQKKGSCSVKCLTLLVKNELGEPLWHDFKLFYTQRQLSHFDKVAERLMPRDKEILKEDVQRIHKKRYDKAHPAPAVEQQKESTWSFWNLFNK